MQKESIKHTVTNPQKQAFTNFINEILANDGDLKKRVPMSADQIFNQLSDGIILCKLINTAVVGKVPPISPQAINMNPSLSYHKIQNINLAISSAKSIGCTMINIRPQFILQKRQHIVLGLIWQLMNIYFSNRITLKKYPEIMALKRNDEETEDFCKLSYQQILIRWLNYHINKNGSPLVIKNLGVDLADSQAYGCVLANVANLNNKFWAKNKNQRSIQVIQTCKKQKISTRIKADEIVCGNVKLNTILCVDIFNSRHGLTYKQLKIVELPDEIQTDQSRETRIFKNWINSQGINEVYVQQLIKDLKDGKILLKVLENFKSGLVDWNKRYSNKLNSRIHAVQNCNYALQLCKSLDIKLVGIDGVDIVDGKIKLILGLIWQICKIYWEQRVGKINQQQLVQWANSKVPEQHKIKSLKDPSISNCRLLLHVIDSIKAKTVNFQKIKDDSQNQNIVCNINYTIASARKLGAEVFPLWEHIKEVNPKYIGILLAQLHFIEIMRTK